MKTIYLRIFLFAIITGISFSCSVDDNVENLVPAEEADLGSLIELSGVGKILGAPLDPSDLENSAVNIQQFEVSVDVSGVYQDISDDVVTYQIFKQLNGGEKISLGSFEDLANTYEVASLEELLSGFNVTSQDLRIGDTFTFSVEMLQTNGQVYASSKRFNVVVNCLSNLAGTYTNPNLPGENATAEVIETAAGVYEVSCMPYLGFSGGTVCISFEMTDTCGTLELVGGELVEAGYELEGGGVVNPDGSFTITYKVPGTDFDFTDRPSTYTPQ